MPSQIAQDVVQVLAQATTDGNKLYLPPTQLDRKLYTDVNKVIDAMGGKWKGGKVKAHVFSEQDDPAELLAEVLDTGMMPEKNPLAYFFTPEIVGNAMAEEAELDAAEDEEMWLEPSCGEGHLLKVMDNYGREKRPTIHAVELDQRRCSTADDLGIASIMYEMDFLVYANRCQHGYHRILQNPPFSVKGNYLAYADHIMEAFRLLVPGGILVAVAPAGITFNKSKKAQALHGHLKPAIIELPEGAFKEAGTMCSTVLVKARKPKR